MPPKRSSNSENDANKKRSRKSVTLETKLEILRRIEAGEKLVEICKFVGLPKSTVQTIRDNKEKIKEHSQSAAPLSVSKLTRLRSGIMEKMEKLLVIWIEDNNQRRMPMSQMTIQEKAKNIFENLKSGVTDESSKDVTFQGSRGWFEKFKNRHNLHNLKMKGEAASADDDAAKEYPNILKKIIERGEQVFNVDETGLYWKRMPERTFILKSEKSASGYKLSKERLTLLLGANSAGDFKLKPDTEPTLDEEPVIAACPKLRLQNLSNALSHFEQGINLLLQNDLDPERSAKVCRGINATINCYKELEKEAKSKARQTTLDKFFKPR